MNKNIVVAACAALMLGTVAPVFASEVTHLDWFKLADKPMVLVIADNEQVLCGDVGLKEVEDGKYVYTLEETPETKHLCAPDDLGMTLTVW